MADGVKHGERILRGAHKNAAKRGASDGEWNPHFGFGRILKAAIFCVSDYADDLKNGIGNFVFEVGELQNAYFPAQRIFSLQIFFDESLVDYGEFARAIDFGFGEGAAVEELDTEYVEIAFAAELKDGLPFIRVRFVAGNFNFAADAAVWRKRAGFGGVDNAGKSFEALEERTVEAGDCVAVL